MHPVIRQRLAAEHIKAMTAATGKARPARQAHRARPWNAAACRRPSHAWRWPTVLPLMRQSGPEPATHARIKDG